MTLLPLVAACIGAEATEPSPASLDGTSILVNAGELAGMQFASNWAGHGPVKRVRFEPCSIEIEMHDGSFAKGSWVGVGRTGDIFLYGTIEVTATERRNGTGWAPSRWLKEPGAFRAQGSGESDVWMFSVDYSVNDVGQFYVKTLYLTSVDAPGYFGERSMLWFSGHTPGPLDEACLGALDAERIARSLTPDGRIAVHPRGRPVANASLRGVYVNQVGTWRTELRIGSCQMTSLVSDAYPIGDWRSRQGSYMAYGGDVGILDVRFSETSYPQLTADRDRVDQTKPSISFQEEEGFVYAYRREPNGGLSMFRSAAVAPGVQRFTRVADYTETDLTWCLP